MKLRTFSPTLRFLKVFVINAYSTSSSAIYASLGHDFNSFHILLNSIPSDSVVKNLPAIQKPQDTWVQSLDREDPLKKGMATNSNILDWRIPWAMEPGRL